MSVILGITGVLRLAFCNVSLWDENKDEASGAKNNLRSNHFQSSNKTVTTARPDLRESPRYLHKTEIESENFTEAFASLKSRNSVRTFRFYQK